MTQRTELAQAGEAGNTREEAICVAISGHGGNASASVQILPGRPVEEGPRTTQQLGSAWVWNITITGISRRAETVREHQMSTQRLDYTVKTIWTRLGSIRSSPRDGLSSPYRLNKE